MMSVERSPKSEPTPDPGRRDFLKSSALAAAGGLVLDSAVTRSVYAAGDELIRVGLVGCGGRGTGAAVQTLRADPNTKLVAMADAFSDHLERSHSSLIATEVADQIDVPPERRFVGFDAYKQLIDSGVDLVLLATPPHFRPEHFAACVAADKHTFVEKPVAVDGPGVRSVLATSELARQKGLMVVSGLCWRYETNMQETIKQIHDGAIGDIISMHSVRYSGGVKSTPRQPGWSEMEYQMRNWYYFTWLSGDFNTEQFVHELDKLSWVKGEYPVRVYGTGGRQARTGEEYGHIYDHFSTVYEYADGTQYYATTRHQRGCSNEFTDWVFGTEGTANLMKFTIEGKNPWRGGRRKTVMHQLEHDALYAALRKGEIINNGDYMAKSTMMGIIARMVAYTGKSLTWEQAMASEEKLGPKVYDWNADIEVPTVAVPGVTPFI